MEKQSFVKNGVLRLPPGFRFHPTDEELIVQYLRRKVFSCPLPASIIPEIDLGRYSPWDLLSCSTEERYFFSLREAKYLNGSRANRATGSGYWKATGKEKPVVVSRCNHVVGTKQVLVFYQGKPPNGTRTNWMMHEYRLYVPQKTASNSSQKTIPPHGMVVPMRDWVLCRIYKKKRAAHMDSEEAEHEGFMAQNDNDPRPCWSSSSSSDSSCVTDGSPGSTNGEETSSSSTKSSP